MDINSEHFALNLGQVEVVSSVMVSKLYLHLKTRMIALVTHGKELEINICGPMTNSLELEAAPTKEDSLFIFRQIYIEEPVIQTPAMKTRHYLKTQTSNVDVSKYGHSMTEIST